MNVQAQAWPWPTAPQSSARDIDPIVLQIERSGLFSYLVLEAE